MDRLSIFRMIVGLVLAGPAEFALAQEGDANVLVHGVDLVHAQNRTGFLVTLRSDDATNEVMRDGRLVGRPKVVRIPESAFGFLPATPSAPNAFATNGVVYSVATKINQLLFEDCMRQIQTVLAMTQVHLEAANGVDYPKPQLRLIGKGTFFPSTDNVSDPEFLFSKITDCAAAR